mgnify:CR=1 FL=1
MTDFNLPDYRAQVWKGFVQFQDGSSNWWRLKEKQSMSTSFAFERTPHYSDTGRKYLDPSGYTHRFSMTLKLTADMFENVTNSAPTNTATISYWIYKNSINQPVEMVFVNTFETLSAPSSEKYIHFKFKLDPNVFGPITLNNQTGSPEITISGEITEIVTATRESAIDVPSDPTTAWHP